MRHLHNLFFRLCSHAILIGTPTCILHSETSSNAYVFWMVNANCKVVPAGSSSSHKHSSVGSHSCRACPPHQAMHVNILSKSLAMVIIHCKVGQQQQQPYCCGRTWYCVIGTAGALTGFIHLIACVGCQCKTGGHEWCLSHIDRCDDAVLQHRCIAHTASPCGGGNR